MNPTQKQFFLNCAASKNNFLSVFGLAVALWFFISWPCECGAQTKTYATNSLIIPMDVDYQNSGMFRAYGLVYKLLSSGVPVDWTIKQGKTIVDAANGRAQPDFTASFRDIKTSVTGTHDYRGGPFVLDATNRTAALPIIQAWQANNVNVVVQEATASFSADVGRLLVAAPRVSVFADGNQGIAFSYLNAASIPDSQGNPWPANSADLLTPAAVAGATTTNHHDGTLFDSNGVPRFSLLVSMHYNATSPDLEAIAELGEFLKMRTLFMAECQAARTFENNGHFLTDQGLTTMVQPSSINFLFPDKPISQEDGPFGTVGGSEPSYVPTGSYLGTEGVHYFRILRAATTNFDVGILGYAYQKTNAGRVFYLGGHQYATTLPLSSNPTSEGVRYFLNSLLLAPATALGDGAANLATALIGLSSPTTNRALDFSLSYQNASAGVALDALFTVAIPSGTTASLISSGGTNAAGQITWALGNLTTNAAGVLSFRLGIPTNGIYTINSTTTYKRGITVVTNLNSIFITNTVALAGKRLPLNQIEVTFSGDTNRNYELQASTNLLDWLFLTTLNSTNGQVRFVDLTTNFAQRFYRVKVQ